MSAFSNFLHNYVLFLWKIFSLFHKKRQFSERGRQDFFHVVLSFISDFYPKPTLLAQPGPVVLPEKNVTLHCQGPFWDMRFALLKEGTQAPLQIQSASGNSVDFLLHTTSVEDSGNYSCVYYETTMSNRGSQLSTPVMIWVTGKNRQDTGLDWTWLELGLKGDNLSWEVLCR